MHYTNTVSGHFISRPNRFIAHVEVNGRTEICHVKNTGRCQELLIPGTKLILEYHPHAASQGRKTSYDVIGVYKKTEDASAPPLLINMDSQAPNQAAFEWLKAGGLSSHSVSQIRREVTCGSSRFDLSFLLDQKQAYMEVKGVTLEHHGTAAFPDAPTERGIKHLKELTACAAKGIPSFILFVIQMKGVSRFIPNVRTHPEFGCALAQAQQAGVQILAYDCLITEHTMSIDQPVPVNLREAFCNNPSFY